MENKIISKLPKKQGFGVNSKNEVIDWKELECKMVEVIYNGEVRNIFIEKYERDKGYLTIYDLNNKNIKLDIHSGSFKKCKIGKLYKTRFVDEFKNNEYLVVDFDRCQKELGLSKEKIENISHGSSVKLFFKCKKCGSKIDSKIQVASISKYGRKCDICSDNISYPEKVISNVLMQLGISFKKEYSPKWIKPKRYDFYLPKYNCIIETHGGQHYEKGFKSIGGKSLKEEQLNDKYKKEMALNNGIKHYIELDCRKSDISWIKNSLVNSEIKQIIPISNINWGKCIIESSDSLKIETWNMLSEGKKISNIAKKLNLHEGTIYRYIKEGIEYKKCSYLYKNDIKIYNKDKAIQMWNIGMSVKEISKNLNIWEETVVLYLKEGFDEGICSYNSKKEHKKSIEKSLKACKEKNEKKVICLNNNMVFSGVNEVGRRFNINFRNVSLNCRGKRVSCGKDKEGNSLRWMFLEDYNNINEELKDYKEIREFLKRKYGG